jgi:hypothetical protein
MTDYKAFARQLSNALLKVRPLGGSELFTKIGDDFFADPVVCSQEIELLRNELNDERKRRVRAERALRKRNLNESEI